MTTLDKTTDGDDFRRPVLLVVDAHDQDRATIESALIRRFALDFRVVAVDSADAALDVLSQLADTDSNVAIVAADRSLPGTDGVSFLEQAHALHRGASRILLVSMDRRDTRIPFGELESLQRAVASGRIDVWILKGWVSPDEWFYPQIQEAISLWLRVNRPHHEVLRVVGEQWSPRSHELRDALARNTVPFGFYSADSGQSRQLIHEHQVDPERLPAVILRDGSVLHDPTLVDIADALGVHTRLTSDFYDLVIIGAGPAGLASAVYGTSEGLRTLVIEPQAIGGQAGTSSMIRNYLGFPRGVSGSELTFRAWEQSLMFSVQFVFMQRAMRIDAQGNEFVKVPRVDQCHGKLRWKWRRPMTKLGAGYVVVDVWKAKPGKENEIEPILADSWRRFSDHPDILSIDYARAEGNSGRFLVVFRYRDEQARERFVATDELKSTMSRLSELWDLDGIFYKGPALEV